MISLQHVTTTELKGGRMLNSKMVLLVLVCKMHFWVRCFLYSLEICCLPFFTRCFAKLEHQGNFSKNLFFFKLCSFLTTDPFSFLHMVQMLLPILPLLSSVDLIVKVQVSHLPNWGLQEPHFGWTSSYSVPLQTNANRVE